MTTSSIVILGNPRSGTTYLLRLLASHNDVKAVGEPLNAEHEIIGHPFDYIDGVLAKVHKPIVGFKCFPEQLLDRNVQLDDLLRHLRCTTVVVIWRRNLLEMFVSRKIAYMTGEWYSENSPTERHRVRIDEAEFLEFADNLKREWAIMGSQWPIEVVPLFVAYEDLAQDGAGIAASILSNVNLDLRNVVFRTPMQRQNPWPLHDKVSNWDELADGTKRLCIDVPRLLSEAIFNSIPGSREVGHLLPHREPPIPAGGWLYRVAEPYMPPEARRNVTDSVNGRCVSSAGHWPKELAARLRALFGVPVAQPCANGFTALVLAMQTAGIQSGDEVIVPAFTMIAVPNSVHFVGAVPIVVDNARGQYNPDSKQILEAATEKTKAVIISHTYGVPMADISDLAAVCRQKKWTLIEDIAETVGIRDRATGKLLGTFGDFACASMYANKIVHAGDGGFVIAADPKHDGKLTSLVNHGFTRSFHFLHLEPAINAKINGIGAAVAVGVLERVDHIMEHRRLIAQQYRNRLASTPLRLMPQCGQGDTPWIFGVVCETKSQRNALRRHLAIHRVESRDYFLPVHLQPASEKMNGPERRRHLKLPVSEKLGSTGFYLPLFTDLTSDDVDYICDVVVSFFDQRRAVRNAPKKQTLHSVGVKPGDYALEAVEFDRNGRPVHRRHHGHPLIQAVMLKSQFERHMVKEKWDDRQQFLADVQTCISDAQAAGLSLSDTFQPILDYFETQDDFEPDFHRPWLAEQIDEGDFAPFANIPTTTDTETLQFLAWLVVNTKAKTVLELGGWLGRTSGLLGAAVLKNEKASFGDDRRAVVYVLDCFEWQAWMNVYLPNAGFRIYDSFLDKFQENMSPLGNTVRPRQWEVNDPAVVDNGFLPDDLDFDLVYVDFTEIPDDLEKAWGMIRKHCEANRSIVVFNGFVPSITPFFTKYHSDLRPLNFKPHTTARAFLFVGADDPEPITSRPIPALKKKLAFLDPPSWDHHHQNAFVAALTMLQDQLHEETAPTAFLYAVEEYMCDRSDELANRDWIGIIHQVPHNDKIFYHPDLHRLCTNPDYRPALARCRGLFTLTGLQANFLRHNLPSELGIPVCQITYPSIKDVDDNSSPKSKLTTWTGQEMVPLAFVGSFARDVDLFYRAIVPENIQKTLVAGDEELKICAERAPETVHVLDRLGDGQYEDLLSTCVAFLSLTVDGAANTLVVECIARGTPILAPRWSSACVEYLGAGYPLFYDYPGPDAAQDQPLDLTSIITPEKVKAALDYFATMEKGRFRIEHFCDSVVNSAVVRNIIPVLETQPFGNSSTATETMFPKFDVTICICSYKRTRHLPGLLDRLWNGQKAFKGSMQIIVWNNNEARHNTVRSICEPYLRQPTSYRRMELIQSTQNYYCTIRMCMPALMRSDRLLICDDDVVPEENFVHFFYGASVKYPEDVLCVRGHTFFEHQLDLGRPESAWHDYESLRFINDDQPMQFIHFAHADACLIPKAALREWASVEAPDPTFALVDDYWMSFVLNHQFGRNLRKLCTAACEKPPLQRTDDSDTKGLALHTRPEVMDARIRLYIHHMLRGWPNWPEDPSVDDFPEHQVQALKEKKRRPWQSAFVGFNVSSKLSDTDADDLVSLGVRNVRIGAVGVRKERDYEFSGFNTQPRKQLKELLATIDMLAEKNINVVLTLDPRIDLVDTWMLIAKHCFSRPNVIGYDLINEPVSDADTQSCWMQLIDTRNQDPEGVKKLAETYQQLIKEIDKIDPITPILLEPPFWGHSLALPRLESILKSIDQKAIRSRILLSFHFYDPQRYTQRRLNQGRYVYPGDVPVWTAQHSETFRIDQAWIQDRFATAAKSAGDNSWAKIVVGEVGVARNVTGAVDYLRDTLRAALELDSSIFLFSFRDGDWEAMDYEKGTKMNGEGDKNEFMILIKKAILEAEARGAIMAIS